MRRKHALGGVEAVAGEQDDQRVDQPEPFAEERFDHVVVRDRPLGERHDVGGRAPAHAPVAGEREQREAVGDVARLLGRLEHFEALRFGRIQER